jgi:hypothetical protein
MFYYNYNRTFIIGKGAMLCYAMLCCAMLCYAVLCYAMLCYAMLCCAMLFYGDDLGQVSWVVGVDVFVDREII